MTWVLVLIPLLMGGVSFVIRSDSSRRALLVATAAVHLGLTSSLWTYGVENAEGGWLEVDSLGLLFLSLTSILFLAASIGTVEYLAEIARSEREEEGDHRLPESVFTACLLLFLATMTFVCLARHFGWIWIGVEATTLATAPLIIFHRHSRSLEAMWKYLLICSVGIAFALMANFLLAVSAQAVPGGRELSLDWEELLANAALLHRPWLKAAFIFLLIGYGTKMGLAPLHTWLPDAHSEAPSPVSALLSGTLLNCAFLAILRGYAICVAAGEALFAQDLFLVLGVISLVIASIFLLGQTDYKRLLAYSSVEHMGILSLGIGLGKSAIFGSLFHAVNHSLLKGALFLTAGQILLARGTKIATSVRGLFTTQPWAALLWMLGGLAILALPPFGIFFSEWIILREAFLQKQFVLASVTLLLLGIVFFGMAAVMLRMVWGKPGRGVSRRSESIGAVAPPLFLLMGALLVGTVFPEPIREVLTAAARILQGGAP